MKPTLLRTFISGHAWYSCDSSVSMSSIVIVRLALHWRRQKKITHLAPFNILKITRRHLQTLSWSSFRPREGLQLAFGMSSRGPCETPSSFGMEKSAPQTWCRAPWPGSSCHRQPRCVARGRGREGGREGGRAGLAVAWLWFYTVYFRIQRNTTLCDSYMHTYVCTQTHIPTCLTMFCTSLSIVKTTKAWTPNISRHVSSYDVLSMLPTCTHIQYTWQQDNMTTRQHDNMATWQQDTVHVPISAVFVNHN